MFLSNSPGHTYAPFVAFVQDTCAALCSASPLPLQADAVAMAGTSSRSFHTAILLLERMIMVQGDGGSDRAGAASKRARLVPEAKDALWYELARLHHTIGEDDVLRGIFRSEVRSLWGF